MLGLFFCVAGCLLRDVLGAYPEAFPHTIKIEIVFIFMVLSGHVGGHPCTMRFTGGVQAPRPSYHRVPAPYARFLRGFAPAVSAPCRFLTIFPCCDYSIPRLRLFVKPLLHINVYFFRNLMKIKRKCPSVRFAAPRAFPGSS